MKLFALMALFKTTDTNRIVALNYCGAFKWKTNCTEEIETRKKKQKKKKPTTMD